MGKGFRGLHLAQRCALPQRHQLRAFVLIWNSSHGCSHTPQAFIEPLLYINHHARSWGNRARTETAPVLMEFAAGQEISHNKLCDDFSRGGCDEVLQGGDSDLDTAMTGPASREPEKVLLRRRREREGLGQVS